MVKGEKWPYFVPHAPKTASICRRAGRQIKKKIRECRGAHLKKVPTFNSFHRFLYMRSFVADGNKKAIHLKQKDDTSDVWLTGGEGFMTNTD